MRVFVLIFSLLMMLPSTSLFAEDGGSLVLMCGGKKEARELKYTCYQEFRYMTPAAALQECTSGTIGKREATQDVANNLNCVDLDPSEGQVCEKNFELDPQGGSLSVKGECYSVLGENAICDAEIVTLYFVFCDYRVGNVVPDN